MRALSIGASGMYAQQMNVEVISNNIANMTTTGYKRERAEFQDLLYQNIRKPGATSSDAGTILPAGLQVGSGVKLDAITRNHSQGTLEITDNALDIAIRGDGYFQIQLPSGQTAYSRAGNLQTNQDGLIVTKEGYQVQPGVTIPADAIDVNINKNGEVWIKIQGETDMTNVGQIELANFPNDNGLEHMGDNMFLETAASGAAVTGIAGADGFGDMQQGALEQSNVNIVNEITKMISAQRAYEMNSKVIKTSDDMLNTVSQMR